MPEKTLTLTEEEANEIYRYLVKQPYAEVVNIIRMMDSRFNEQNKKNPE